MNIKFCLAWASGEVRKAFKSKASAELFHEFIGRIDKFDSCEAVRLEKEKKPATKVWICHTGKNAKMLSSEALAESVQSLRNSGIKELRILIGPADGFSSKEVEEMKPDFLWSFGPMTYPHDLAAVIAAEQIYRAYTILHNFPYHKSH